MTTFRHTAAGQEFVASGASRETSPEIMEAIAYFARNTDEAEAIWSGDFGSSCNALDIWARATSNGVRASDDYCWGAAGSDWYVDAEGRRIDQ